LQKETNVIKSLFFLFQMKYQRDKRKSRKGEPFGQCLKMGYDLSYTRCFAFAMSGSSEGTVDQAVTTKVQVSLCPKGARAKFYSFGQTLVPHISITRRASRAFNKTKFHTFFAYPFYRADSRDINYKTLLRNECRDSFETIES
jgi:hypothetical protein